MNALALAVVLAAGSDLLEPAPPEPVSEQIPPGKSLELSGGASIGRMEVARPLGGTWFLSASARLGIRRTSPLFKIAVLAGLATQYGHETLFCDPACGGFRSNHAHEAVDPKAVRRLVRLDRFDEGGAHAPGDGAVVELQAAKLQLKRLDFDAGAARAQNSHALIVATRRRRV